MKGANFDGKKLKMMINNYGRKPRLISKIIMLSLEMIGDNVGKAHHCGWKHDDLIFVKAE